MRTERALRRLRAPDEAGAEARAWEVVRRAHAATALDSATNPASVPPVSPRRTRRWAALAPALAALAGALALSPAGAAVTRAVSHVLQPPAAPPMRHGTMRAFPSPPARGTVLASNGSGTWTIGADGGWRRLGPWRQAAWSPGGLYVAVAGQGVLAAVNPRGVVIWNLPRAAVHDPVWYAPSGYRIAYLSGRELRVVAGDGTGDHLLVSAVSQVAPAWRPGQKSGPYELAYVTRRGTVALRDADSGALLWQAPAPRAIRRLQFSADGRELLAVAAAGLRVYDPETGAPVSDIPLTGVRDAALAPGGDSVAVIRDDPATATGDLELRPLETRAAIASATGPATGSRTRLYLAGLRRVAFSPDGRWLIAAWPAADEWLFVRTSGSPGVAGVTRLPAAIAGAALEGWCCASGRTAG